MYRTTKQRAQRVGTWVVAAVAAVALGVTASHVTAPGSTSASAPSASLTSATPASSATIANSSGTASVQTAASSSTNRIGVTPDTVTALANGLVTVRTSSGSTLSYSVNSSTVVLKGHTKVSVASLGVGARVFVIPSTTSPTTAQTIGILPAASGEGGRESAD